VDLNRAPLAPEEKTNANETGDMWHEKAGPYLKSCTAVRRVLLFTKAEYEAMHGQLKAASISTAQPTISPALKDP
jgi:hypothetical protein